MTERVKNAWIDRYGEFHECNFFGHEEWAREYLGKNYERFVDENGLFSYIKLQKLTDCNYAHEYLCKNGWLRLLTWDDKLGTKVVGYVDTQRPNEDQNDALYLYCAKYGLNYNKLFER